MYKRTFVKNLSLLGLSSLTMNLQSLQKLSESFKSTPRMPVLFIGHGSPMNAIEDNVYTRSWAKLGKKLPHPNAILCVSAHWQTQGSKVTAMSKPRTIHDFGGFPESLNKAQYAAPGAPEYAYMLKKAVGKTAVEMDHDWGLDHGTWSVLKPMYPNADIPTFQLSMDYNMSPLQHYELAKELAPLRLKGILIMGSGNIVHNLRLSNFNMPTAYDWAIEFDTKVKDLLINNDHKALIDYHKLGEVAKLSVPTNEHYLPMLYTLALRESGEQLEFSNTGNIFGGISMRSFIYE